MDKHEYEKCLHHIKEEEEIDLGVEFGENEHGDSLQSEDFNEVKEEDQDCTQSGIGNVVTFEEVSTSSELKKYRRETGTASLTSRRYACDVCEARFTQSRNLKIHRRIHTNERPHTCDVCTARFNQSSNLKRHQRLHTKEKPYTCDVCKSRFTQSGNLKIHRRIHTKEKPYTCDVCTARFSQSNNLKRHHKSRH